MGKLKTHKATSKRFRLTKRGKFLHRAAGQDHFNSRESGTTTMGKRRDRRASKADVKAIRRQIPYA
ncbi:MAG: 50S ribosomal protein L35 [Candidatus Giovannonibacteria bacterium GW2011_GWA2_53_7]|uniref:Large ribosomal subunit protein bL35 n=1 Tax=Candidatus Giovannonibacteria bacterium GW2011_GWA2_53_7 TaxID=1618650 RepID=A0A0G1XV08_9BACT|nr:MAG: 50S ribosomal protein L35 [Candidatus Giovannonibacteria bacterium GW2011_GWA2_53_7]